MFRSIPEESTKVKSLLGGTLMAYQVPPPAPIQPMSAAEEREEERRAKEASKAASTSKTPATSTLGDIQRRTTTNSATINHNNNYLRQEQKATEGTEDTSQSSVSNHLSSSSAVCSSQERGRAVLVNGDHHSPCDIETPATINEEKPVSKNDKRSQGHISDDGDRLKSNSDQGNTLETNSDQEKTSETSSKKEDMSATNCNGAGASVSRVDAAALNGDVDGGQLQNHDRLEPPSNDIRHDDDDDEAEAGPQSGFVVAVHRKILRMDVYFLSSQKSRPSLFGTPLLLPFYESTSQQDLYASVWTQIARLVSPLPPSEASSPSNHALDCDDSLGYEYPFVLKRVKKDGYTCSMCPWYRFCRGCPMECNATPFRPGTASLYVAVDWDPTALHLRYQASQERAHVDDESVALSRHLVTSPIDLDACLQAFTKEEELGEDERVYCKKCASLQCVSKKLDIWELPPILIIHLKRFQYVNARWVKSSKVVKFPMSEFEPAKYLAPRDRESAEMEEQEAAVAEAVAAATVVSPAMEAKENGIVSPTDVNLSPDPRPNGHQRQASKTSLSEFIASTEEVVEDAGTSVVASATESSASLAPDGPTGILPPASAVKDRKSAYNLYGISCHNGILGGGHYVSYAQNSRSKKWYCYNDSSCREVSVNNVDFDSAYLLFYERQNLENRRFLPRIPEDSRPQLPECDPLGKDNDKDFDTDYGKACVLQ